MIRKYVTKVNAPMKNTFYSLGIDKKRGEWVGGQIVVESRTPITQTGVGTKFHHSYWPFWEYDGVVIAYDEPVLFGIGFKANTGTLTGTIFYRFKYISENKTELNSEIEIADGNIMKKTVAKLLKPIIDRVMNSYLQSVKKRAETEFSGAQIRD